MEVKKVGVNYNLGTKELKGNIKHGFYNVDDPDNWIVNDGNGGVLKQVYYKRNNNFKKNKKK